MVGFGFFFRPLMVMMATLMGFVPFTELMLPFITASFGRLSSLDGPSLQLTHSQLFLFLQRLCRFRFFSGFL
jgi:hypothetical protein